LLDNLANLSSGPQLLEGFEQSKHFWTHMTVLDNFLDWVSRRLTGHLTSETPGKEPFLPLEPDALRRTLRRGDVLLVSGSSRLSGVIKYLTHSPWSHAALYVGEEAGLPAGGCDRHVLVEVAVGEGCISAPLSKYTRYHTRICRPVGLTEADCDAVVRYMISHLGTKYDTRNVIDLARYLFPAPPVPSHLRRRMIALGSGDPTRSICSTLIADAFEHVRYPILPNVERLAAEVPGISEFRYKEILHIRHHSLFTPADFDFSPYFEIVKPAIEGGFNYKTLNWGVGDGLRAA
jgi:Permuted papain-like amidase enzyme, YaeF/YiiX, C92 family